MKISNLFSLNKKVSSKDLRIQENVEEKITTYKVQKYFWEKWRDIKIYGVKRDYDNFGKGSGELLETEIPSSLQKKSVDKVYKFLSDNPTLGVWFEDSSLFCEEFIETRFNFNIAFDIERELLLVFYQGQGFRTLDEYKEHILLLPKKENPNQEEINTQFYEEVTGVRLEVYVSADLEKEFGYYSTLYGHSIGTYTKKCLDNNEYKWLLVKTLTSKEDDEDTREGTTECNESPFLLEERYDKNYFDLGGTFIAGCLIDERFFHRSSYNNMLPDFREQLDYPWKGFEVDLPKSYIEVEGVRKGVYDGKGFCKERKQGNKTQSIIWKDFYLKDTFDVHKQGFKPYANRFDGDHRSCYIKISTTTVEEEGNRYYFVMHYVDWYYSKIIGKMTVEEIKEKFGIDMPSYEEGAMYFQDEYTRIKCLNK